MTAPRSVNSASGILMYLEINGEIIIPRMTWWERLLLYLGVLYA